MTQVLVLLLALLIGVVAGLRTFAAPAAVSWAALLDWINLSGTWASWVGHWITVTIVTIFAIGELIGDKLPRTASRTTPVQFTARIITGAFAGTAIGTAWGYKWGSLGAGIIGAVLGTVGGYQARRQLVAARGGQDLPIALLEDSVAVLGGFAIVAAAAVL